MNIITTYIMQLRNRNIVSSATVSTKIVYSKHVRICDVKSVKKYTQVLLKPEHRIMQLRNRCVEFSF